MTSSSHTVHTYPFNFSNDNFEENGNEAIVRAKIRERSLCAQQPPEKAIGKVVRLGQNGLVDVGGRAVTQQRFVAPWRVALVRLALDEEFLFDLVRRCESRFRD